MKLSIITVNLNNKDGLPKTIDSVISQTFKDFEWIVIDGGSTDGSKELIEKYSDHISYWVSEPDNGIYNAMNKGIKASKGEYLLFLNSGDIINESTTLEDVFNLYPEDDIVTGQVINIDTQKLLRVYNKSLFMQLYNNTLNHQGTFIKRSLFKDRLYDETLRIVSDWKFWLQTIIWGNASTKVIDVIVSQQEMNGISNGKNPLLKEEREKVKKEFFPPLLQKELDNLQEIRNSDIYRNSTFLKNNHPKFYALFYRISNNMVKLSKKFG